jgi:superfamily I DNA and/or RNA helicase
MKTVEQRNSVSRSCYNPSEADSLILYVCKFLEIIGLAAFLIRGFSIGIITPYSAQVECLSTKIQ